MARLKAHIDNESNDLNRTIPGVVLSRGYPNVSDKVRLKSLHARLREQMGDEKCRETFGRSLQVCMMSGNELWNTMWVSRRDSPVILA